jgi:hypothetical protein
MKKNLFIFLIIGGVFTSCSNSDKFDENAVKNEMKVYANEYMQELKSVLVKNMQAGGPLKAVNVCYDTALVLTKNYSADKKVAVKRFSFNNRNENNVPDEFEKQALQYFEELADKGKLNSDSEILEREKVEDITIVRYVKPIFIDAPCLNCHGNESQISKEVAEVLKEKYPNDKAIGYKIGDLRGAISVVKEMK